VTRTVWSFWSKPFEAFHHKAWISRKHHLLSWILSLRTAQHHYPDTSLVTDDAGAHLLLSRLGLRFETVSLALNDLKAEDPHWWCLGKLYAYRSQQQPFIHIDNDVFLWHELPVGLVTSPVMAQNPERFVYADGAYRPDRWEAALLAVNAPLPPEWLWYTRRRGNEAVGCGIVGGTDYNFLAHYAEQAIKMVRDTQHRKAPLEAGEIVGCNILAEQYLLAACLHYHRMAQTSRFAGLRINYLFDSDQDSAARIDQLGYTHLIAGAKQNAEIAERLERRVSRDYPREYATLMSCIDASPASV
jgi:hypothetical protein